MFQDFENNNIISDNYNNKNVKEQQKIFVNKQQQVNKVNKDDKYSIDFFIKIWEATVFYLSLLNKLTRLMDESAIPDGAQVRLARYWN